MRNISLYPERVSKTMIPAVSLKQLNNCKGITDPERANILQDFEQVPILIKLVGY